MRIAQAFAGGRFVEIESGEIARVGVVAKSEVDAVGAAVDRSAERGQCTRRTDELYCGRLRAARG